MFYLCQLVSTIVQTNYSDCSRNWCNSMSTKQSLNSAWICLKMSGKPTKSIQILNLYQNIELQWFRSSYVSHVFPSKITNVPICSHMGVSENSVPLIPMLNDHYPYYLIIKWLFHWEYTQHFQTNPYFFLGVTPFSNLHGAAEPHLRWPVAPGCRRWAPPDATISPPFEGAGTYPKCKLHFSSFFKVFLRAWKM